jgi:N-carbamoylputrescine amidase
VLCTRPIIEYHKKFNEGFVWDKINDYKGVHRKYYLPDDEGWWEASWYDRGNDGFSIIESQKGVIGFLICTELWFTAHAREHAKQRIEL